MGVPEVPYPGVKTQQNRPLLVNKADFIFLFSSMTMLIH